MQIMAKIFSTKVVIKYLKFHQHRTLASIISSTEDVKHYMHYTCYTEQEGVAYFIQKLIGGKNNTFVQISTVQPVLIY